MDEEVTTKSLELREWTQGVKFNCAFPAIAMQSDQRHVNLTTEEQASQSKHLGSARRIPATSQGAPMYHQKPIFRGEGTVLQVGGLSQWPDARNAEFWLRKASAYEHSGQMHEAEEALMEALQRDVQPATAVAHALHQLHKKIEGSMQLEAPAVSSVPTALAVASTPKSLTPTRTGVTGKAMRVPSRLAKTPGAQAAVPPPTNFKGILKRLEFSTDCTFAPAGPADGAPLTTTKQLLFDGVRNTPMEEASYTAHAGVKSTGRRVTFGAATASPRGRRPAFHSALQSTAAISEGDSEDHEGVSGGSAGTVNSRNAGATPFDRRLSALFAKYHTGEDDAQDEAVLEEAAELLEDETAIAIERLSGASITDSIKALTGRYVEEEPGHLTQTAEDISKDEANQGQECFTDVNQGSEPAPALPFPSIESNDAALELGALLRRSLEDIDAAKAADASAVPRSLQAAGIISPNSGILSVSALSPSSATSLTPMSIDGVQRDASRIPIVTPGTVNLFRGSDRAPRRDDGIEACLARTFDTPTEEDAGFSFKPLIAGSEKHDGRAPDCSADDASDDGTPDFQPKSASKVIAAQHRSLTPLTRQGPLGAPQRVVSPMNEPVLPLATTRELRALLDAMSLTEGQSPEPSDGRQIVLSPVRASPRLWQELGVEKVATPVRRSPRTGGMMPETVLESAGYVYVPNDALQKENTGEGALQTTSENKISSSTAAGTETIGFEATPSPQAIEPAGRSGYNTRSASKAQTKSKEEAPGLGGGTTRKKGGKQTKGRRRSSTGSVELSPTEEKIRESLRRSARRKSMLNDAN